MLDAADQAPKPQRLIIYHPWVYLKSGLERTLLEIARRSRHEVVIHTSHFDPQGTYPELSDYSVKEHTRVSVRRTYWEVIKAARAILGLRFDPKTYDVLVISCDGLGPLLMFRNKGKPALNLVFTPLRAVYDEVYRAKMLEGGGFKASLRLVAERVFKLLDRRAWRHFDGVISISKTVTHRIVRDGLYEEDRIVLSYAGIDAERIGAGKPPEKYFFLPGRIMWTKNISLAIEAFGHLRNAHPDWRLVIGGMVDAKSEAHFAELKAAADNIGNIEFRRDLTEAEMLDLYDRCSCVVMTALNEDQGLTPLEGAARSRPCIAVARGGPLELIVDGETGFLVEPDPETYAGAMRRIIESADGAAEMGAKARERVRNFTWQSFVKTLDDEIDRIVRDRQS